MTAKGIGSVVIAAAVVCATSGCEGIDDAVGGQVVEETSPPSGEGLVFYDGFESGDNSHSENGYSWQETSGSPDHAAEHGAPVIAGDWAHRFRNNQSTQQNRLIRIHGPALTEFWFEYWIRIPGTEGAPDGEEGDYFHDDAGSANNKWTEFFPGSVNSGRNEFNILPHTWPNSSGDGGSLWRNFITNTNGGPGHHGTYDPYIVLPDDLGRWFRLRYWVNLTTLGPNEVQIEMKHWLLKEGAEEILVYEGTQIADDAGSEWHKIENWQIYGFNNSLFPNRITWYVDEVRLYNQDPQW